MSMTLVLALQNSKEPHQRGGALKHGYKKILRFSTEIAFYLGNGTRLAHGYYGSLMGNHVSRSIRVGSN